MTHLKKIKLGYYVVVTDEPIKEGDYILFDNKSIVKCEKIHQGNYYFNGTIHNTSNHHLDNYKKITHSTQPIEQYYSASSYINTTTHKKVEYISLSEVELIVESDTNKDIWECEFINGQLKLK